MTMHNHEPGEPLEGADVRLPALQSVADPAPLGLAAFAMTTFALSLMNANIWPAAIFPALALALVYGGFAQLLAGMWEFVRKNTFGALAFTSYGAFWISYYVFVKFLVGALKPALVPSANWKPRPQPPPRLAKSKELPGSVASFRTSLGAVKPAANLIEFISQAHAINPRHACARKPEARRKTEPHTLGQLPA